MIEFVKDPQNTIPSSLVKIIGLGGAGANMIDRVALDGMEGAEILALNSDIRTLAGSVAPERIQLGCNLTKGLGAGGDPDLGQKVMMEAEKAVRSSIRGRKIVFLCVGLGGGTGSGGAPILTRIAREEGAFVVIFATMPFAFEGSRRRDQAETALNELAVLSNALVVFDNTRMGELVLAKQGIHEAFAAADRMISDSIKAVIRLVIRPGIIHVGLDELMIALRATRSRCLFGSGTANGKDRASKALANALSSPLLDKGALLKEAATILVHICGGEDLTLYEVELLMQKLAKYLPQKAHVLFGAAIDSNMKDGLSITLISALPEEKLQASSFDELPGQRAAMEPSEGFGFDDLPPLAQVVEAPAADVLVTEVSVAEKPAEEDLFEDEPSVVAVQQVDGWVDFQESNDVEADLPFAEGDKSAGGGNFSLQGEKLLLNSVTEAARDFREVILPPDPAADAELQTPQSTAALGDLLEKTRIRLGQNDMLFEGGSRGKFADTESNLVDGDDLDIPPFMRKKKK